MTTPQHKFPNIVALFNTAKQKLQRARLQIAIDGIEFCISAAPSSGRNPGCLYVKRGETYLGKIFPNASYTGNLEHIAELRKLDENPVQQAIMHGKQTGFCCFCSITLTDPRSVAMGYGPICAGNWGLPWGDERAAEINTDVTDLVQMAEDISAEHQKAHRDDLEDIGEVLGHYSNQAGETDNLYHSLTGKVPMTVKQIADCIVHDYEHIRCPGTGIALTPSQREDLTAIIIRTLIEHPLINS